MVLEAVPRVYMVGSKFCPTHRVGHSSHLLFSHISVSGIRHRRVITRLPTTCIRFLGMVNSLVTWPSRSEVKVMTYLKVKPKNQLFFLNVTTNMGCHPYKSIQHHERYINTTLSSRSKVKFMTYFKVKAENLLFSLFTQIWSSDYTNQQNAMRKLQIWPGHQSQRSKSWPSSRSNLKISFSTNYYHKYWVLFPQIDKTLWGSYSYSMTFKVRCQGHLGHVLIQRKYYKCIFCSSLPYSGKVKHMRCT